MADVSVAIPTYNRGRMLVDTLQLLLRLNPPPKEIIVADQTAEHERAVTQTLDSLNASGHIRWIRLEKPSIPRSMNVALLQARSPVVLFLDDDVVPSMNLVETHQRCYADADLWAVCGRVVTPHQKIGEEAPASSDTFESDLAFPFHSSEPRFVRNVIACNLSVRRQRAIAIGGFDENFVGAAYRFETDFARRLWSAGGKVWFEPAAGVLHLQAPSGGVRSFGQHLKTASPAHSVGDYYFALEHARGRELLRYIARRLAGAAATRFHLRHPWYIAPKLLGEIRGLLLGLRLKRQGRRLLHG